jgi:hypothetical protein
MRLFNMETTTRTRKFLIKPREASVAVVRGKSSGVSTPITGTQPEQVLLEISAMYAKMSV